MKQYESRILKTVYLVIYAARAEQLINSKGIKYNQIPVGYLQLQEGALAANSPKKKNMDNAIAKVGDFLGRKENWDAMLGIAEKIVRLFKVIKS